eukprot:scaffold16490_cov99-Isochrysis_galbana.AAC.1
MKQAVKYASIVRQVHSQRAAFGKCRETYCITHPFDPQACQSQSVARGTPGPADINDTEQCINGVSCLYNHSMYAPPPHGPQGCRVSYQSDAIWALITDISTDISLISDM